MKVYLGADHGGFELKEKVKAWLSEWRIEYEDMGPETFDPKDDYPVYAFNVAERVGKEDDFMKPWSERTAGILVCRSAVGVTIAANKVKGVLAGAAYDTKTAHHARTNDNINVLCLSGDWMSELEAQEIVRIFFSTEFSGDERHKRRLEMIRKEEN